MNLTSTFSKKHISFSLLLLSLLILSCQAPPEENTLNKAFNDYQLTNSGAGEALDAWFFDRSYPSGEIPPGAYEKAYRSLSKYSSQIPLKNSEPWESLGPENIAGRTLCLAFHPDDPNIIYAGSASGGLWKTTTQGRGRFAWERVSLGFPALGVSSILIDPNDPEVIYLGTGESYHDFGLAEPGLVNRLTRGTYGIGILKSTNGGASWEQILVFEEEALTSVNDMEFNPLNTDEIFAATTQGTYRSLNGGADWTKVLDVRPSVDVEIDPRNGTTVYVSTGNLNLDLDPNLSGLYKSEDKGASFAKLQHPGLLDAWSGNAKLTLDPNNPDRILASIQVGFFNQQDTTPGGVFESLDAGVSWERINDQNVAFWQGWYSHDLAINPANSAEVMYVGIDTWKSFDNARNFSKVTEYRTWLFDKISVDFPEGDDRYVHADIHAVYYHPSLSNTIFFATDGGVFVSEDGGNTYETRNGGMQTSQFYANFASSAQRADFALGGTQDNCTYIYDGTDSWTRVIGGDGMSAAVDPFDDRYVYGSAQNLFLLRSDNFGEDFFFIAPPQVPREPTPFAGQYELAPSEPNIIYAGRQDLYRSDNRGDFWEARLGVALDGSNMIVNIAVAPQDPDLLYVATGPNPFDPIDPPKLFKTVDGGLSFERVGTDLPNRVIKDIAIDPLDANIVYVVFSGFGTAHLAKTVNGGLTWEANDNLPDLPANTILIDPENTQDLYFGNDLGVFYSEDAGASWEWWSDDFQDGVFAMHLSLSVANRKVRLASHGRGVYEKDLVFNAFVSNEEIIASSSLKIYPNPVEDRVFMEVKEEWTTASLRLYNNGGQLLRSEQVSIEDGKIEVPMSDIATGIYSLVLEGEGRRAVGRVVKK